MSLRPHLASLLVWLWLRLGHHCLRVSQSNSSVAPTHQPIDRHLFFSICWFCSLIFFSVTFGVSFHPDVRHGAFWQFVLFWGDLLGLASGGPSTGSLKLCSHVAVRELVHFHFDDYHFELLTLFEMSTFCCWSFSFLFLDSASVLRVRSHFYLVHWSNVARCFFPHQFSVDCLAWHRMFAGSC